jgi:hypothetical protein
MAKIDFSPWAYVENSCFFHRFSTYADTIESNIFSVLIPQHLLPGPPFLFGSILALIAIIVTLIIPPSYKSSILLSSSTTISKQNKEKTVVKIGNTSNTYNRTSSSSSIAPMAFEKSDLLQHNNNTNKNSNLLSSHLVYASVDYNNVDESEYLLMNHESESESETQQLPLQASEMQMSPASSSSVSTSILMPNNNTTTATGNTLASTLVSGLLNPIFDNSTTTLKNLSKNHQSVLGAQSGSLNAHNFNLIGNSHNFEHDTTTMTTTTTKQSGGGTGSAFKAKSDLNLASHSTTTASNNTTNSNLSLFSSSSSTAVKYFNLQNKQSLD